MTTTTNTIEERVTRVETSIEFIRENMATKADLAELKLELSRSEAKLIRWMIGSQIGLVIALSAVMRLLG